MHRSTQDRPFTSLVLTGAALLFAAQLAAADAEPWQPSDEQRARIEARFEEIRERLDLSEEQKARLEPVLREDFEKRVGVMRKYGVTRESGARPNAQELRALRRELQAVGAGTDAEVERILDDRQMQEYRKIREEARDEMRERVRSQRQEPQE